MKLHENLALFRDAIRFIAQQIDMYSNQTIQILKKLASQKLD